MLKNPPRAAIVTKHAPDARRATSTLTEFTRDLYEVPGKVEAAMRASCDDLISTAVQVCKSSNKMLAFIVLERGSGFYYRLDVFERFEWPFLQRYVDAFVAEGITPWLHLETDWGINLPHFTKLPKGKCVCDLDSTTDIFRAKEILKGHMCISGDVPAALLSLGKPEEVEAYCKRLIDEVGEGGGFMLTTGCECPINVKRENLRAMVETGKSYSHKHNGSNGLSPKLLLGPCSQPRSEPFCESGLRHGQVLGAQCQIRSGDR